MPWTNLTLIQPAGSGIPVFCVQGDQANRSIPEHLGTERPFYAFIHQGNDGHRIELDRVEPIASHFIKEMKEARPKGPYLLCGYSFGGILAYEMAQQLLASGDQVPMLVLFDSQAPQLHAQAMKEGERFYAPLKDVILRNLVEAKLRKGAAINGKLRHFHIIDTYDRAIRAYTAKPIRARLTVFKAEHSWGPMDLGWHRYAKCGFDLEVVSGDHNTMLDEPHVAELAEHLRTRIAFAEQAFANAVP